MKLFILKIYSFIVLAFKQSKYILDDCLNVEKPDSLSESRPTSSGNIYVPRDEAFSQVKSFSFGAKTFLAFVHGVLPSLETVLTDHEFQYFTAIDMLFNEGIDLPLQSKQTLENLPLRIIKAISDTGKCLLRFETPQMTSSMYKCFSSIYTYKRVRTRCMCWLYVISKEIIK